MNTSTVGQVAIVIALLLVVLLAILAVGFSIAAMCSTARRRGLFTVAVCLWCTLAGYTLSGAIWSWMTQINFQYQQVQLRQMPPKTLASEVQFNTMAMLQFFIKFDDLGHKLLYSTVLIPLILSIRGLRNSLPPASPTKPSKQEEIDAMFRN